jgi:hypothetical protein
MSDTFTVAPERLGARFRRQRTRAGSWYAKATMRYVRNLARKRVWWWANLEFEIQRRPWTRDWMIYVYCDFIPAPDGVARRLAFREPPRP